MTVSDADTFGHALVVMVALSRQADSVKMCLVILTWCIDSKGFRKFVLNLWYVFLYCPETVAKYAEPHRGC